ncbi:unnamed protein product [Coccothraustes coccothraustes]
MAAAAAVRIFPPIRCGSCARTAHARRGRAGMRGARREAAARRGAGAAAARGSREDGDGSGSARRPLGERGSWRGGTGEWSSREGTAASARLLRRLALRTELRAPPRVPAEPMPGDPAQPSRAQPCPCHVRLRQLLRRQRCPPATRCSLE